MLLMSATSGRFVSVNGAPESSEAAIRGREAFFAPQICTVPSSRWPPSISSRSMALSRLARLGRAA